MHEAFTEWLEYYHRLKRANHFATRRKIRRLMKRIRREAALERKLEAAQRRIAELETEIARMHEEGAAIEEYIYPHTQRVMSDHDARLLEQWHERM